MIAPLHDRKHLLSYAILTNTFKIHGHVMCSGKCARLGLK